MHQTDRQKLLDAGFTVLRDGTTGDVPALKRLKASHSWELHAKFPTKAALEREIYRIHYHEPKMIFES